MSANTSGIKSYKNNNSGSGTGGNQSPLIVEGLPPNMNKPSNAIIIEGFDRIQNSNMNNNAGGNSSGN